MDWLTHNAIADIPGPQFLAIYCMVAAAVIAAAYGIVRRFDRSGSREPPQVPSTLDPYELAYLRGGKNDVIRTALYALHQLGLIEVVPVKWTKALRPVMGSDVRPARRLTALEEQVLRSIDSPVETSYLFQSKRLGSEVERLCEPFRQKLESEGLLRSKNVRQSALLIPILASAVLVALSLLAANDGLPFGFLIVLTAISLMLVWIVVVPVARARVSDRGRAYLNRLRLAYAGLQPAALGTEQSQQPDQASVLLVSLFGLRILSDTPDAAFASTFAERKASEAVGGCGGATGGLDGGHGHGGHGHGGGHGCSGGHGGGHGCGGGGHGGGCGGGGGGGGCGSSSG